MNKKTFALVAVMAIVAGGVNAKKKPKETKQPYASELKQPEAAKLDSIKKYMSAKDFAEFSKTLKNLSFEIKMHDDIIENDIRSFFQRGDWAGIRFRPDNFAGMHATRLSHESKYRDDAKKSYEKYLNETLVRAMTQRDSVKTK